MYRLGQLGQPFTRGGQPNTTAEDFKKNAIRQSYNKITFLLTPLSSETTARYLLAIKEAMQQEKSIAISLKEAAQTSTSLSQALADIEGLSRTYQDDLNKEIGILESIRILPSLSFDAMKQKIAEIQK